LADPLGTVALKTIHRGSADYLAILLYPFKERRPIVSINHYERIGRPLGNLLYPFKERRPMALNIPL
jgi:hypothetical protein